MKWELIERCEVKVVELKDLQEVLTLQDANTRKVFNFLLQKFNQTKSEEICFSLNEIVEQGIYKSEESALLGVDRCIKNLMDIQVESTAKENGKVIGTDICKLVMKSSISIDNPSWVSVSKEVFANETR